MLIAAVFILVDDFYQMHEQGALVDSINNVRSKFTVVWCMAQVYGVSPTLMRLQFEVFATRGRRFRFSSFSSACCFLRSSIRWVVGWYVVNTSLHLGVQRYGDEFRRVRSFGCLPP
jgi:hypothetical protein